jgi:hypothetical protein
MAEMLSHTAAIALSAGTGIVLELGIAAITGRRESWDSGLYWTVGLPAALAVSCIVGYLAGRRGWFWTGLIVPSQVLVMMLRSAEISGLWPLTIVLSSVLGAPFLVASFIASRFRPVS